VKTLKVQLVIGAALFAGVAIGYFARPSETDVSAEDTAYVSKKCVSDKGGDSNERVLRRRIAELERLLAKKGTNSETAISNAVAEAVKNASPFGPPRGNPREWMENLKKTDPARFAQMTNRFAQWRQRRAERARNTIDFLSSIDTSHMSASAKKTHDELQELIAKREELEELIHQEDLTEDQRHQLMEQMRETDQAVRKLKGEERTNLIEETARNLGFEGDAVQEISTTLQEVIEATDSGRGGFGTPPGGGPGGGPGGPGPGGPSGR